MSKIVKAKRKINSCVKGKVGERDFCHFMKSLGYDAWRSQQFKGGGDSADVESPLFALVHPEIKRVEKVGFYEWFNQAKQDAERIKVGQEPKTPVVFHRKNRGEWMAFMQADELLALLSLANAYLSEHGNQCDLTEGGGK